MWVTGNIRRWCMSTRPHRNGPDQKTFSANNKGYLQVDAYPAYDKFFAEPARELVGLVAAKSRQIHLRRWNAPR